MIVIAENAHAQEVHDFIRGRYFSLPYYVVLLSFCLTLATVWVDLGRPAL